MHIPDRVYGIETEYACMLKKDNQILDAAQWPKSFLLNHMSQYADRTSCVFTADFKIWHSNGSLSYLDTGNHPEHASAEARSVRETVLYSQTGDRIMQDLFHIMRADGLHVLLFKNNIAPDFDDMSTMRTFGCHENYLVHAKAWEIYRHRNRIWDVYNHKSFIPFVVTRQILDGTGSWDHNGRFFLSQRARCVGGWQDIALSINVKFSEGSPRVHLTYGDSSILDMAAFLKIGTTSLALSLVEGNCLPDITCVNPRMALLDVSQYGPREKVVYLHSGEKMSAYEIQVLYWETIRRACKDAIFDSDEVAAETEIILLRWEQALNAIAANDMKWMFGHLDWATKQRLAEREIINSRDHDTVTHAGIRKTIDLYYHSIADGCMRDRIYARFPERRLFTNEEIAHACANPPARTRAKARAMAIRMVIALVPQCIYTIDWHEIRLDTGRGFCEFKMDDPLNSYEDYIEAIEKNLKNCAPDLLPLEEDYAI
ncbi:MAG: proteasome accessory factor PafA2 family protein [Patescibacteria group bacterium]